jgi:hypothetical protein
MILNQLLTCRNCLPVILLSLFCTCKSDRPVDFFENISPVKGETVAVDCMIGRPVAVFHVEPQKVILYDPYDHKLLTLVDLSADSCVRFMREGPGPDELRPGFKMYVSPENQTAGIYHAQTGILKQYDLQKFTLTDANSLKPVSELKIEDTPSAAAILPAGKHFIGIGGFAKGRIHLYNQEGKHIASGGKYPFRGEEMDPVPRFLAYQSYIASNGKDKFVVASAYGDNLEFYAVEKDSIVLKKKYETRDAGYSFENGFINLTADCLLGYKGAWGGKKYCYLLFSGKSYAENSNKRSGAKRILVFSWDGRFVKSYEAEDTVWALCADEESGVVYAVADHEEETVLLKYAL